jgi:hypothetical protein
VRLIDEIAELLLKALNDPKADEPPAKESKAEESKPRRKRKAA